MASDKLPTIGRSQRRARSTEIPERSHMKSHLSLSSVDSFIKDNGRLPSLKPQSHPNPKKLVASSGSRFGDYGSVQKIVDSHVDDVHKWPILDFSFFEMSSLQRLLDLDPRSGKFVRLVKDPSLALSVSSSTTSSSFLPPIASGGGGGGGGMHQRGGSNFLFHGRSGDDSDLIKQYNAFHVKLSNNGLTSLSNFKSIFDLLVSNVLDITILDLSFNKITSLDEGIVCLAHLRVLHLHANSLSDRRDIPKILPKLPSLKTLSMHGNPMLEKAFKGDLTAYRSYVISSIPWLKDLDFVPISPEDRQRAEVYRKDHRMPKMRQPTLSHGSDEDHLSKPLMPRSDKPQELTRHTIRPFANYVKSTCPFQLTLTVHQFFSAFLVLFRRRRSLGGGSGDGGEQQQNRSAADGLQMVKQTLIHHYLDSNPHAESVRHRMDISMSDQSSYGEEHMTIHPKIRTWLEDIGFEDCLFASDTGFVFYTFRKGGDFGAQLDAEPFSSMSTGGLFKKCRENPTEPHYTHLAPYPLFPEEAEYFFISLPSSQKTEPSADDAVCFVLLRFKSECLNRIHEKAALFEQQQKLQKSSSSASLLPKLQ